jgi:hypothetical protein
VVDIEANSLPREWLSSRAIRVDAEHGAADSDYHSSQEMTMCPAIFLLPGALFPGALFLGSNRSNFDMCCFYDSYFVSTSRRNLANGIVVIIKIEPIFRPDWLLSGIIEGDDYSTFACMLDGAAGFQIDISSKNSVSIVLHLCSWNLPIQFHINNWFDNWSLFYTIRIMTSC